MYNIYISGCMLHMIHYITYLQYIHTFIYVYTDIYMVEYYSAFKKEASPDICDNMDEPKGHYAKWNKPGRERQTAHGTA